MPYVRGWSEGKRGADTLAQTFRELGLDIDFPGLRADVNVFGEGVVRLGVIRPEAAELLTRLLTTGVAADMARQAYSADGSASGPANASCTA